MRKTKSALCTKLVTEHLFKDCKESVPATTSLTIAKTTGKRHDHILRDIENLLKIGKFTEQSFKLSSYRNKQNKKQKMYVLDDDAFEFMKLRYTHRLRLEYRQREEIALITIEQLLNVKLVRQFEVAGYRIDGYDPVNNVAYEIDESHHNGINAKKSDHIREKVIEKELGCTFKRITIA